MADELIGYGEGGNFWIVPYTDSRFALNVSGTSVGTNNQNVNLYTRNGGGTQAWYLDTSTTGYAFLRCTANSAFGLDRYSPNNNCDIYRVSGNAKDANIDFHTNYDANGTRYYKIKNVASGLFLTSSASSSGFYNGANVTWAVASSSQSQRWQLIRYKSGDGVSENYAVYPCHTMRITQRHDDLSKKNSHGYSNNATAGSYKDYPIDEGCEDSGRSYLYCPCDEMEVKRIYGVGTTGVNTIWLRSTAPVKMPFSPTKQYLVLMVEHPFDDSLRGIAVGKKFTRNQAMFLEGGDSGNPNAPFPTHFHLSCGTGDLAGNGWSQNGNGAWVLTVTGQTLLPTQAFYLDRNITTVSSSNGYTFTDKP